MGLTHQDGWRIKLIKCGEYKEEGEEHVDEEEVKLGETCVLG